MKHCSLVRGPQASSDQGTPGKLFTPDNGYYTNELPKRDVWESGFTCIPLPPPNKDFDNKPVYLCKKLWSPKHGRDIYHVTGVANCEAIEIHSGNYAGDTRKGFKSDVTGCIILGLEATYPKDGQFFISRSKEALKRFEAEMNGEDFTLSITEAY